MSESYRAVDKGFFENLLIDNPSMPIEIEGTTEGYIIYSIDKKSTNRYLLHNIKKDCVRRFKSPSTLFKFLAELGVKDVKVTNINLPEPDSYVRNNAIRHLRPDRIQQQNSKERVNQHA